MKLFSIQTSYYPGYPQQYNVHFETGIKSNPFVMLPISKEQHETLLEVIADLRLSTRAEIKEHMYIHYIQ